MSFPFDPELLARVNTIRGPIADPGPDILGLMSEKFVAKIKYRQMEMVKVQAQQQVELAQLAMEGLAEKYPVR
jgi:hypothetical protein